MIDSLSSFVGVKTCFFLGVGISSGTTYPGNTSLSVRRYILMATRKKLNVVNVAIKVQVILIGVVSI
jgi:hypothetical protein